MHSLWTFWAKLRLRGVEKLLPLLLGRVVGRMHHMSVRDLHGFTRVELVWPYVIGHQEMYGPLVVNYSFPYHFPPRFRRSKAFDARNLYYLSGVRVATYSGIVYLPDGSMVGESPGGLDKLIYWGSFIPEVMVPSRPHAHSGLTMLVPCAHFYHFFYENLPAILRALEVEPDVQLLLDKAAPGYVAPLLDMALGKSWRERCQIVEGVLEISNLLLPAVEPVSGFPRPEEVNLLRNYFFATS